MVSLFKLRKNEPDMERPFKVPLYPLFPAIALIISIVALLAMIVYNQGVFMVYVAILAISYIWFIASGKHKTTQS
jgi:ethanolamine permease